MSQIQIAVFLLIPLFLASVAWLWTIVLAFRYKDFGMAILSILLPAWMVVYQLIHPVRCRIPLGAVAIGAALLTLGCWVA
jgi:hypothetical protein